MCVRSPILEIRPGRPLILARPTNVKIMAISMTLTKASCLLSSSNSLAVSRMRTSNKFGKPKHLYWWKRNIIWAMSVLLPSKKVWWISLILLTASLTLRRVLVLQPWNMEGHGVAILWRRPHQVRFDKGINFNIPLTFTLVASTKMQNESVLVTLSWLRFLACSLPSTIQPTRLPTRLSVTSLTQVFLLSRTRHLNTSRSSLRTVPSRQFYLTSPSAWHGWGICF